jgi:hypothetical protein
MFESGRGWLNEAPNDPSFCCDMAQLNATELDGKSFDQVLKMIETAKIAGGWLILAGHEMNIEDIRHPGLRPLKPYANRLPIRQTASGSIISIIVASWVKKERLENSISEYRKGEIIVKAKPGSKITVEQLKT